MKVVSLKIEEELDDALEEIAERQKISKSELIRRAVLSYLNYLRKLEEQTAANRPYITRRVRVY